MEGLSIVEEDFIVDETPVIEEQKAPKERKSRKRATAMDKIGQLLERAADDYKRLGAKAAKQQKVLDEIVAKMGESKAVLENIASVRGISKEDLYDYLRAEEA